MKYEEKIKDLFTVSEDYYFAQCISADFGMRAGIAVCFNEKYNMKNILMTNYPEYLRFYIQNDIKGDCILENRTFNLITKERCYHSPTYENLMKAIDVMVAMCKKNNITKIAMPTIGAGIDGLEWSKVSKIIQDKFHDLDIEILVCKLK